MRLSVLLVLAGCTHALSPAPAPAPAPVPARPPALPMSAWTPGATVTVVGRISTLMWQHMTRDIPGKRLAYFDIQGESHQTVVYWTEPPTCSGPIEVTGKVIELRGSPKRAGERESKADESYAEQQIDVDRTRCIDFD